MSKVNDWLYVVMEEYKSIRQESFVALQAQQSTLAFGIAVLGAIIYWAISQWDSEPLLSGILFGIASIVSNLVIIIWIGEVVRMARTLDRLWEIEKVVNKSFVSDTKPLGWICWIKTRDAKFPKSFLHYIAVICLFIMITGFSLLAGIYQALKTEVSEEASLGVIILALIFVAIVLVISVVTIDHVISRYASLTKLNEVPRDRDKE